MSGRRAATLAQDARILGLDGAIAEVGTVVIREGVRRFTWGACPPSARTGTPRDALAAAGADRALLAAYPDDLRTYEPWDAGREGGFLMHGRIDIERAEGVLERAGIGWATLLDNGPATGWEGRDDIHAYHLVARGVGKAAALSDDLALRGVTAQQALAIGDSTEDQTMASVVGTYVLVGNAHGTAGGNRFRVAGRNGDGVAEALTAALDAAGHRPT